MFLLDDDLELDIASTIVESVFDAFDATPGGERLDLNGFAEKCSGALDQIIIKKMRQGNEFVAGRFKLMYVDDKKFKFGIDIYFRDPRRNDPRRGKYVRLNGDSKLIPKRILTPEAHEELKLKREIIYDINAPVLSDNPSATGEH